MFNINALLQMSDMKKFHDGFLLPKNFAEQMDSTYYTAKFDVGNFEEYP